MRGQSEGTERAKRQREGKVWAQRGQSGESEGKTRAQRGHREGKVRAERAFNFREWKWDV